MSTITSIYHKSIENRRVLIVGLIVLLSMAITTGFAWFHTDHVIAPPGLRLMDGLWKLFICRCSVFPDLLGFYF
jgi:hypothetical protein